jgi:hypothetical protein
MAVTERPILYLDIDGVLNCKRNDYREFDPICVTHLVAFLQQTDSEIVLSSTWRNNQTAIDMVNEMLTQNSCRPVIDFTLRGTEFFFV